MTSYYVPRAVLCGLHIIFNSYNCPVKVELTINILLSEIKER